MNNVYFANEGITSSTANFYANIAKELQSAATERLNSVKFFKTSVAVIGSNDKQLMGDGTHDLAFITADLEQLASLNAFCAWVREAIKEKEAQQRSVQAKSMDDWAKEMGIVLPEIPKCPRDPEIITEDYVINSWDLNKRNKYLRLEAFAATYGKYIHPEGAYSKARKKAHNALNNPITKEGTGRDMILYYAEPSVAIGAVDAMFLALQSQYREYEKELNQMKAEIKDTVTSLNADSYSKHQSEMETWDKLHREYNAARANLYTQFASWRNAELKRISNLKITIPESLKGIFHEIKEIADISKK